MQLNKNARRDDDKENECKKPSIYQGFLQTFVTSVANNLGKLFVSLLVIIPISYVEPAKLTLLMEKFRTFF
ncbi:hypothetical protein [Pseudoalteromonas luteoviolacea]|uniref:hypothetical protein n=1 Tax=Pseudoalteromonas luteoviolacea TaxID=43657 RepID=UPI001B383BEE|nr:hypothetical protein [Pseudoalteromonas luteoviolacea]MBQ4838801.1 hypothetical protein [Pseudoalteromonas luteoviolacea]